MLMTDLFYPQDESLSLLTIKFARNPNAVPHAVIRLNEYLRTSAAGNLLPINSKKCDSSGLNFEKLEKRNEKSAFDCCAS